MNKMTEIIFIIDRSGSMNGLQSDTIGGYNSFLEQQKQEEGEAMVTTVLFNNRMQVIHDRETIANVRPLTARDYIPGGSTALLDAVGDTVNEITRRQETFPKGRPDSTVAVIITDGYENSSRHYTYPDIRNLIKAREEAGWKFVFLGANIDAEETAETLGMDRRYASRYHADAAGTRNNYDTLSDAIRHMRRGRTLAPEDLEGIRQDYRKRGGKH